jgi:uncharacterized phage protein gp47/JayE
MSVNQLDNTGLQIKSATDVLASLVTAMHGIYGADINVGPNTPDGQQLNIFTQAVIDILELLLAVFNSFDIDSAFGTVLDARVALNGLKRIQGTYTVTPVSVTASQAVTIYGLDELLTNPNAIVFTIYDGSGNYFQLMNTYAFGGAGSQSLNFQAVNIGAVLTTLNTITNVQTVTAGITAVNNPLTYTSLGVNEETDSQLKIRRIKALSLFATSPADAVRAAILNIAGVTDCYVFENNTGSPIGSIPAHTIWAVVEGGADADIGQAIYSKKSSGCGMYGASTAIITRPAGDWFTAQFDRPTDEDLYVKFMLIPRTSGVTFDETFIKNTLSNNLVYKMGQSASIDEVIPAVMAIVPDAYVTACQVSSDDTNWYDLLAPTAINYIFVLTAAHITISYPA